MTRAKPKAPHVHVVDQDIPADPLDTTGRRVCAVCHPVWRSVIHSLIHRCGKLA